MDQIQRPGEDLDYAAFERVWRKVMPEDRLDCPFTLEPSAPSAPTVSSAAPPAVPPAPSAAPAAVPPAPHATPAAARPTACLGEDSAVDLPGLERVLRQTTDDFRIYRALARRTGQGSLFSPLAGRKKRQVKRLTTAAFLISGKPYTAPPTPAPEALSLPLTMRERFQAEQRAAAGLLAAAEASSDPCLAELYRILADEDRKLASRLWVWLEEQKPLLL